jgi:hypothetical protein
MGIATKMVAACMLATVISISGCRMCGLPSIPSHEDMAGSWVGSSRESTQLVRMDFDADGFIEVRRDGKHWRSTKPLHEFPTPSAREDYDVVASHDGSAGMLRFNRRFNSLDVEFITNERREGSFSSSTPLQPSS